MIEYIITAGFLTAAGLVVQYKRHKKNMAKIKARHEKEKHYLRRDQRLRLKAAKARKKELEAIVQARADKDSQEKQIKVLTDALQAVSEVGGD